MPSGVRVVTSPELPGNLPLVVRSLTLAPLPCTAKQGYTGPGEGWYDCGQRMTTAGKVVRAAGAIALSSLISVAGFIFFGALLPIWTMIWKYGRQEVQDAPGHGSLILFVTLPIAGISSLVAFILLAVFLYRRFLPKG